jgi:WD40 repeat protein
MGTFRAVKVVYRASFEHDRPFEREFEGIQKFEPISRTHESQVDILHVGRNEQAGYFYYVMELADAADASSPVAADVRRLTSKSEIENPKSENNQSLLSSAATYTPRTLKSELLRRGRLPLEECLQIGLSLTTALEHLHKHGLVHRDVKPSNIIFVNGIPKLADIGLVASMDATLSFVGTAGYLPPEGPGTPQADIYSLGKVLYELCTGRDRQNFPELPAAWEEFVEQEGLLELNAVLMKACESDARKRYPSAQEMHADLALLQTGKSVKRLRAIERRLSVITRIGLAAAATAVLAVAAYFGAVKQARRAQRAEREMAQQLYVSDINRAIQLWEKGNLKRALDLLEAHRPPLKSEIRNPKSEIAADLRGFEWFYLWRLCHQDDARRTFRAHTNGVYGLAFSPDGALLATAGADGTVVVWNTDSWQEVTTITNAGGPLFAPDGRTLTYATMDTNGVVLFDLASHEAVARLGGGSGDYFSLAFSTDGRMLVAVEVDSTAVALWDVASRRLIDSLRSEEGGYVYGAAFSPDGKLVVAGHRDNLVTFWDVASRRKVGDLAVPFGFVTSIALSPDGATLVLAGDTSSFAVCDVESRRILSVQEGHDGQIYALTFSPTGHRFATASHDSTVKLWDAATRRLLTTFKGHLDKVTRVAFSPDGKLIASGCADGTVKLWNAVSGEAEAETLPGHTDWARSIAFSPDGKTLASAGKDKTVRLWDVASRQALATFLHTRPAYRLAWSPDGNFLASVSGLVTEPDGFGEVKLWDVEHRCEAATLTNLNQHICAVAFSTKGKILAAGTASGSVMLWDIQTLQHIASFQGHTGRVFGVIFLGDDRLLATSSDDTSMKFWDSVTRRELASLPTAAVGRMMLSGWDANAILSMTLSRDGQLLATGHEDGTIRIWDPQLRLIVRTLKGTAVRVSGLAFSPDGRTLVAAQQDGMMTLWNVATGQELGKLKGHAGCVESVAFSPDGTILASASSDKTVRLWRAATWAQADAIQK